MTRKLGEQLVLDGVLTPEVLSRALARQKETGLKLGECLVRLGVDETPVLRLLAQELKTRFVSTEKLAQAKVDAALLERVPVRLAEGFDFMPLRLVQDALYVAISEPQRQRALEEIAKTVGVAQVLPFVAVRRSIRAAIRKHYYADAHAFEHPPEDLACPHCGASCKPGDFQCARCELLLVRSVEDLPPRDNVSLVRALLTRPEQTGARGVPRPPQQEATRVVTFQAHAQPKTKGPPVRPVIVASLDLVNRPLSPFEAYVLSFVDGRTALADMAMITQLTELELRAVFESLSERGVTKLVGTLASAEVAFTGDGVPAFSREPKTVPPAAAAKVAAAPAARTQAPRQAPMPSVSLASALTSKPPSVAPAPVARKEDAQEEVLQRVVRLEQAGKMAEALDLLERSIGLLPKPAPLYNRMGMIILNHQRDYERASAFFKMASDLEPENSVYTMNLYSVLALNAEATNAGQKKPRR
ncbi:general secretion pathway protein GspE [Corallococcus exiguus]|uniref:GspE/PulE/PilB domain-containing protein n=1 Tax=Corallococcus TaxID=83461 RepID=UPI000EA00D44|nr:MULTISPECIES: general secretion pathway protein GspE [Corallococcus]NNC19205.1 general secretion pathway protein GspE [Corallococcus exiguus]NRD57658.1 general secretion pathway protein GspE [Corallococcus exiguus]NRD63523.1 general secretion pathway protein GspE [Corallococcus exiguus]RKH19020.1 general secretion pathway protein GspE [Corallococcus sp. CA041A]RKI13202.1 general secretion pathway protein GspE [Corallococcus sp. AB030]